MYKENNGNSHSRLEWMPYFPLKSSTRLKPGSLLLKFKENQNMERKKNKKEGKKKEARAA